MTTMLVPMIAATLKLDASTPRETATTTMHALEIGAILKLDAVIPLSIVTITMLAPLTDVHEPEDAYTSRQFAMIKTPALAISAILQVDVNSFPSNCHYYQVLISATLFPAILEGELSQPQLFAMTTTHARTIPAIELEDAYSLLSTSMTRMLAQETGATEQQEPSTTTESFVTTTTHAQQILATLSSVASTSMLVL